MRIDTPVSSIKYTLIIIEFTLTDVFEIGLELLQRGMQRYNSKFGKRP